MPLLDWSRTDLQVEFKDGSLTTKFETKAFAAFDLILLQRPQAEHSYNTGQIEQARQLFTGLSESQKEKLKQTVLLGLPGSLQAYSLEELRTALREYAEIGEAELRENLIAFVKEMAPVAEEGACSWPSLPMIRPGRCWACFASCAITQTLNRYCRPVIHARMG